MLNLKIEELNNGYIVCVCPSQEGFRYTEQHVATSVYALGLLVKQLAGAEKHKDAVLKRNIKCLIQ